MHGRHSVINGKLIPKLPGTEMTSVYWHENCTVTVVILGTENYMLVFLSQKPLILPNLCYEHGNPHWVYFIQYMLSE